MNSIDTTKPVSLVELIRFRQAELGLTDQQLGEAIGYERAIVVALIKQGTVRFPINKVPQLAVALSVDAADLMRVALSEASPDLLQVVERTLNPLKLTTAETNLIRHLRKLAGNRAVAPIVFEASGVIAMVMTSDPIGAEFAPG